MTDNNKTKLPFEAYKGRDLYAFISYAHLDSGIVYDEITKLKNIGINIWYDEGIDPGNEWADEIAKALDGSSIFIYFVTPRAISSRNCKNEVHYALNNNKMFLAIHLEESNLPPGLALRMNDIQAIFKYQIDDETYQRKITKATKDFIIKLKVKSLVVCKHCGKPYDPYKGGICSFHPDKALIISNTGPRFDYAEYYEFPCCKTRVFGEVTQDGIDLLPPQSPGCKIGSHQT